MTFAFIFYNKLYSSIWPFKTFTFHQYKTFRCCSDNNGVIRYVATVPITYWRSYAAGTTQYWSQISDCMRQRVNKLQAETSHPHCNLSLLLAIWPFRIITTYAFQPHRCAHHFRHVSQPIYNPQHDAGLSSVWSVSVTGEWISNQSYNSSTLPKLKVKKRVTII